MRRLLTFALILSIVTASAIAQQAAAPPVPEVKPSDLDGAWLGAIDTGAIKLRVVFNIANTANGLTATMDSIDQGAKGVPVSAVTRKGSTLTIDMRQIGGGYVGEIAPDLQSISGTWSQGGAAFPLILKRAQAEELQLRRPQMPVKPYPYREEEVAYDNAAANVKLAATLTIPSGKGPFPAVLLITGSGPQDRDESLMGHKPFLVLADYLTRKGIAVLRADDRGVGKSTGKFANATTADFATDAEAGFAYLLSRPEVDRSRIGLIGHSEGGLIAPMLASRNSRIAFIVLLAGGGVPGHELLVEQVRMIAAASGAREDQVAAAASRERDLLALVRSEKDDAVLMQKMRERLAGQVQEAQLASQVKTVTSPWFRYFLDYDPATSLRKVTCPVLALNGQKDTQVSSSQNLPAIRKALTEAGNKRFEIVELAGLNHLFQTAKTGAPSEYGAIEETMSPVVLEKIAAWITSQAPPASQSSPAAVSQ